MTLEKLQPYDITKVMENMLKTGFKLYKQEDGISCVPAEKYRCELQFVVVGTSPHPCHPAGHASASMWKKSLRDSL
jgi:UDP-N-acetylglucosamine enolpyruvyl transferase